MANRIEHLQQLIADMESSAREILGSDTQHDPEANEAILAQIGHLAAAVAAGRGYSELGQQLICHIVANYPILTHRLHRDLIWLFGGDCLHFLSDDELASYQQLEDRLYEKEQSGETVNFSALRAEIFGLH